MGDRAKPQVGMDPVMELLEFSPESISAAVDSRHLVHVVAADRDNGVIYLVLGRGGIQQREMLLPNWYLGNDLQIAIDDEGIVHAIVGDEHFMRRDGQWHSAGKVHCKRLLRAGDSLACVFIVKGNEAAAPGRWDWYFPCVGGALGAICAPIPWYTHPDKLALTFWKEGAWSRWTVVDVDLTNVAGDDFALAVDEHNDIHILFVSPLAPFASISSWKSDIRYAQAPEMPHEKTYTASGNNSESRPASEQFNRVLSRSLNIAGDKNDYLLCKPPLITSVLFASDPTSPNKLGVVCIWDIQQRYNQRWISFEMDDGKLKSRHDLVHSEYFDGAPWGLSGLTYVGHETWGMTIMRVNLPGLYLMTYQEGRWSGAVSLSEFPVEENLDIWTEESGKSVSPQLVSTRPGEAVALWPECGMKFWLDVDCVGKLMARWITFAS